MTEVKKKMINIKSGIIFFSVADIAVEPRGPEERFKLEQLRSSITAVKGKYGEVMRSFL